MHSCPSISLSVCRINTCCGGMSRVYERLRPLDIPPCRRYVVVKATAGFAVCRLILKLLLFYSCLDFTQNLGKTLVESTAPPFSLKKLSMSVPPPKNDIRKGVFVIIIYFPPTDQRTVPQHHLLHTFCIRTDMHIGSSHHTHPS